jgi:hypothetical protein
VAKRPKYSRWRRLPGAHWINDQKLPDHRSELQRLTLYVPGSVLDRAELLAARASSATVQEYCADLLQRALADEAAKQRLEETEARRGPLVGLDAIANDLAYLSEWSASSTAMAAGRNHLEPGPESSPEVMAIEDRSERDSGPIPAEHDGAAEIVFRHAALGAEDPSGLLPSLRRGEPVGPEAARELLQALIDLERAHRDADRLDRRLAYALHRLAFEGQVLLTDAWPGAGGDPATVDVLRLVQEAVDRVLSGLDIRYYRREPGTEPLP